MSSIGLTPQQLQLLSGATNPQYVVTLLLESAGNGATEQYITPALGGIPAVAAAIQTMLGQRMALSSPIVFVQGIRVAQIGSKRSSFVLFPGTPVWPGTQTQVKIPLRGTYSQDGNFGVPTEFRASINCNVAYANGRTAKRYICSPPSGIIVAEPGRLDRQSNPVWFTQMLVFSNNLSNTGWCIRGQRVGSDTTYYTIGQVVNGTQTLPLLGLLFPAAPGPVPSVTLGQRVAVQGVRATIGPKGSSMNGIWSVASSNTTDFPGSTVVYLQHSGGNVGASFKVTSQSTMRIQVYTLYPIQAYQPVSGGIHKRGKAPLSYRGRRLYRPSLAQ